MATQLQLYNIALRAIGDSPLETLTEETQGRRYLDAVYALGLDTCLRAGFWNFAMTTAKLTPDVTPPAFYYTFAYTKPAAWVRTRNISASETLAWPLNDYQDQAGAWLTHINPLYVRYVSNDASLGGNLARFPPDYAEFVGAYLGSLIFRQTAGRGVAEQAAYEKEILMPKAKTARANDAMDGPAERRLYGSWATARHDWPRVTSVHGGFLHIGG